MKPTLSRGGQGGNVDKMLLRDFPIHVNNQIKTFL